jgi:ABC-type glycerol-3-phosphate transport system permease component
LALARESHRTVPAGAFGPTEAAGPVRSGGPNPPIGIVADDCGSPKWCDPWEKPASSGVGHGENGVAKVVLEGKTMAAVQTSSSVYRSIQGLSIARRRRPWGTYARHLIVGLCVFLILFPIFWVALLSIKSRHDSAKNYIWPHKFDFSAYSYVLTGPQNISQNIINSVLVTVGTVVVTTICAVLAGFALVHLRMPGRTIVLSLFVSSMFFPTRVTALISIWQIQHSLGLYNVTWGLIMPYVTLGLALSVFIMRGMFGSVPREIADAARIDGAGTWELFLKIMLPMVRNGIVVVVIVNFVSAWGEYLLASTLIVDQSARTMPVVLATTAGGMGAWIWPRIAAAYVITITPALIAFAIAQRWYMKGLQEGAMKV